MNKFFERKKVEGIEYNVIVVTEFSSTLCTASGDNIFYSEQLLKSGIEQINSNRGKSNLKRNKLTTNKRRL